MVLTELRIGNQADLYMVEYFNVAISQFPFFGTDYFFSPLKSSMVFLQYNFQALSRVFIWIYNFFSF